MSLSGEFFTQICHCAADTERIDGNICAKNQFNGFITTVEVNGFHCVSFAFQFSSFQDAAGTEYRMSAFGKFEQHVLRDSIQETTNVLARIFEHTLRSIRNTIFPISSFCPINRIVHRHEDDPSFELLWFTLWISHHLLNLVENSQCCESWEIFHSNFIGSPLIRSTQILEITRLQKPLNPAL